MASGCGCSCAFGTDCVKPLDSFATMFWVSTCGCGSGMLLDKLTLMASPLEMSPPQPVPRASQHRAVDQDGGQQTPCNATDKPSGVDHGSRSV